MQLRRTLLTRSSECEINELFYISGEVMIYYRDWKIARFEERIRIITPAKFGTGKSSI